jgi:hypothetical protein
MSLRSIFFSPVFRNFYLMSVLVIIFQNPRAFCLPVIPVIISPRTPRRACHPPDLPTSDINRGAIRQTAAAGYLRAGMAGYCYHVVYQLFLPVEAVCASRRSRCCSDMVSRVKPCLPAVLGVFRRSGPMGLPWYCDLLGKRSFLMACSSFARATGRSMIGMLSMARFISATVCMWAAWSARPSRMRWK